MIGTFLIGVGSGLTVAVVTWLAKWQWPAIRSLFDQEARRQAKQISGTWQAKELFADGTHDDFKMELRCKGGLVTGRHECHTGHDAGKCYDIQGTYKDHILTFTWTPRSSESLESGTVTARLLKDRLLEGHGLYVEPNDGKVYTSVFTANLQTLA